MYGVSDPSMRFIKQIRKAPISTFLSSAQLPDDVISFGQGVPFFQPPKQVNLHIKKYVDSPRVFKYSEDEGFLQTRKIIAEKLRNENKIVADPQRNIIVTAGANQGFMNALLAITSIGDEILFFTPTYFNYIMAAQLAGCKPVLVDTDESYQPNIQRLKAALTDKTKAIVTISPNNPTGAVYPSSVLKEINELCRTSGCYHISDEVYEYFVFDDARHVSSAYFDSSLDHTISLFSCSKAFAMSGYRIGFMVIPEAIYDDVLKVQDTIGICAPSYSQLASQEAWMLGGRYTKSHLKELDELRRYCYTRLSCLSFLDVTKTMGAYYFFIKVASQTSFYDIALMLAEKYGVIVLPGELFDAPYPSFRISYGTLPLPDLKEGLNRLEQGLNEILG